MAVGMKAMSLSACFAAVLLAACAITDPAGTYETTLPAASGGGERYVRVSLTPDGFAAVSSSFSGRPSRFLGEGTWQRDGSLVSVNLGGPRAERLVFRHAGDQLVGHEWDHATWGEAGPGVLYRVLTGPVHRANPASENCMAQGGKHTLERAPGGEMGVCLFEDNRQCEEWALLRGQCPKGGIRVAGYTTTEERHCAIRGGQLKRDGECEMPASR